MEAGSWRASPGGLGVSPGASCLPGRLGCWQSQECPKGKGCQDRALAGTGRWLEGTGARVGAVLLVWAAWDGCCGWDTPATVGLGPALLSGIPGQGDRQERLESVWLHLPGPCRWRVPSGRAACLSACNAPLLLHFFSPRIYSLPASRKHLHKLDLAPKGVIFICAPHLPWQARCRLPASGASSAGIQGGSFEFGGSGRHLLSRCEMARLEKLCASLELLLELSLGRRERAFTWPEAQAGLSPGEVPSSSLPCFCLLLRGKGHLFFFFF